MKRFKKVFIGVLLIAVVIFLIVVPGRVIKVNHIDCQSQFGPCSDALSGKLGMWEGKNLLIAESQIAGYLSKDPLISYFSLQYNIPDILKVRILSRKPQFSLQTAGQGKVSLADKDGTILEVRKSSNLPTLETEREIPAIGRKVDTQTLFASRILYGMFYMYGSERGKILGDSLTIGTPNGPTLIFPLEGDADVLLGSARLIISRLNMDSDVSKIKGITTIDLRFKNPVLR